MHTQEVGTAGALVYYLNKLITVDNPSPINSINLSLQIQGMSTRLAHLLCSS